MIPSVISKQVRHGIEDFIKTTFPVHTTFFNGIFDRFLDRESNEMFRGPYISVKLPFRPGLKGAGYFSDIPMKYSSFLHQEQAFGRLGGKTPKSTIIATGTGSGKTECFMYPILDHCFAKRGEPGIKAIIIYPMNALANDQARRFADIVNGNKNLKGKIRVGLFIGETSAENSPMMTKDNVITDRDAMRASPPDILLTNYKMLDYLLIRPIDRDIWQRNEPETLKYVVVDELHTFDGAQGTDLACLLRRLKSRLGTPAGHLCCVGTSATLGDTQKPGELIKYAENVFGEKFDGTSVVGEKTLQPEEFFADVQGDLTSVPGKEHSKEMDPYEYASIQDYVKAQAKLWFGYEISDYNDGKWKIELGRKLCGHIFFRNLLTVICRKLVTLDELVQEMGKLNIEISEGDGEYKDFLIISLLALASSASRQVDADSIMPFLNLRLQTWLREMRRIVAEVKKAPDLKFAKDLNADDMEKHLPVIHCRECGTMGWLTSRKSQDTSIKQELDKIYESFFSYSPTVNCLFPEDPPGAKTEESDPLWNTFICGHCMRTITVGADKKKVCSNCGRDDNFIKAYISNNTLTDSNGRRKSSHNCPYCNSEASLTVVGSKAPSLISVAISQIFTSIYNDDKKILAFSDSVQDAAHRAGFFSARTFRFGIRTAIQQFISESDRTFTLAELPDSFTKYYLDMFGREKYISTFIATDMEWLDDYEHLLKHDRLPDSSELLNLCKMRIGWEIFSEYGFRSRIGRTLEKTGSSVASFNPVGIDGAVKDSIEILQNQIGGLRELKEERLHSFVLGFLILLKSKGGVAHPALEGYVKNFGNYYQMSYAGFNELFMPKFGKHTRTPVFMSTKPGTRFDQFLNERTWYADWARRNLGDLEPEIHKYTVQLYTTILEHLVESNVLQTWTPNGEKVWGINPKALTISKKVFQLRCSQCGYLMSVGEAELAHFLGRPCLRMKCAGSYEPEKERADYYARLYSTGDIHRINTAEHSSLLEREDRENLEKRFMAEENSPDRDKLRKPWYPNMLSCTPTLEMGIDIGRLSAEIMCNIPPTKSSYLQRIGRTGRRDGNSFNLAVANARPHDLYFFSNPPDMITGNVEAPGCFLNASSVLERQFIAFCFDNWVAGGIKVSDIPRNIGALERNYKSKKDDKFPFIFLKYIEHNRTELFKKFIEIFPEMQEQTKERLKLFVEGKEGTGTLTYRILEPIESIFKEMDSLRGKIKSIRKSIETHKASPANSDHETILDEMENELFALAKILGKISEKDIFNFFTDSGLLPNYAFPESGIQLKSLILRKKKKNDKGKVSVQIYEYERP
ncbi:MAG: DEAD/DEAH box helicase, partial [Victivallales bacterium]